MQENFSTFQCNKHHLHGQVTGAPVLRFATRLVCFRSIFTMFPKDHASQILSKGPVSTKELQEYFKFGGWYVEFMAMSALAQQKQTGGKGIWCSRGLYFGSSPWHGLHTCTPRSVL